MTTLPKCLSPQNSDQAFARWLTREKGVAVIPISSFYSDGTDEKIVRFCFAKTDELLVAAAERLADCGFAGSVAGEELKLLDAC